MGVGTATAVTVQALLLATVIASVAMDGASLADVAGSLGWLAVAVMVRAALAAAQEHFGHRAGSGLADHRGPGRPGRLPHPPPPQLLLAAEDAHIFTTTLRENVRVSVPDAADDAVAAALDRAGLGAWVAGLPTGLDTMLGSGGTGLSGGERRRVLLARAFLLGAGVLLLDEPGEHLDPETADALVGDVLSAPADVVAVTHRLAPLAAADEVVMLEGGTVAARGTHHWLLAHHPAYAQAVAAEGGQS